MLYEINVNIKNKQLWIIVGVCVCMFVTDDFFIKYYYDSV